MTEGPGKLQAYANRQVVITWYEDDGFAGKDGFHFDYIRETRDSIAFIKDGQTAAIIPIPESGDFVQMNAGFPRHYAVIDGSNRTEFYFP